MSKQIQEAYIVAATRLPVGKRNGAYITTRPDDMLAAALNHAINRLAVIRRQRAIASTARGKPPSRPSPRQHGDSSFYERRRPTTTEFSKCYNKQISNTNM